MAKNERVSEETFGSPIPQIPLKKGSIHTFGHAINDTSLPDRGVSVNQKTGFPVKGSK